VLDIFRTPGSFVGPLLEAAVSKLGQARRYRLFVKHLPSPFLLTNLFVLCPSQDLALVSISAVIDDKDV
jgi:hypothetical protein